MATFTSQLAGSNKTSVEDVFPQFFITISKLDASRHTLEINNMIYNDVNVWLCIHLRNCDLIGHNVTVFR